MHGCSQSAMNVIVDKIHEGSEKEQVQNGRLEGMREICTPFSGEMKKTFFKEYVMCLHSMRVIQTGKCVFFFA